MTAFITSHAKCDICLLKVFKKKINPCTKTFQALRIFVNKEISEYLQTLHKEYIKAEQEAMTKSALESEVDYEEVAAFYENVRAERTETTDLEHLIFRDKMDDQFSKALSKLPEDFRTVVLLCDVDGFTYEEISNMLDVPIGTIRSRLHRGRNLLKTELYEHAKKHGYTDD